MVGAGAVGQVYGAYLAAAGATVSVLVKPKHADAARRGYSVQLRRRRRRRARALRLEPARVLTSPGELAAERFDEVWLCVAATALEPAWLDALIAASGGATIVYLQPGRAAKEALESRVPAERLVAGGIGFIAYEAILPGEEREPGTALVLPPGGASRFSGPDARVRDIVSRLRGAGCPARRDPRARAFIALTGAVIQCLVVALEAERWSFARLRGSETLTVCARAARQAVVIAAADSGVRAPLGRFLLRGWLLALGLALAPRFAPFPVEPYLEHHFTKVRAQTRDAFTQYGALASAHALPFDAIAELGARVPDVREGEATAAHAR